MAKSIIKPRIVRRNKPARPLPIPGMGSASGRRVINAGGGGPQINPTTTTTTTTTTTSTTTS